MLEEMPEPGLLGRRLPLFTAAQIRETRVSRMIVVGLDVSTIVADVLCRQVAALVDGSQQTQANGTSPLHIQIAESCRMRLLTPLTVFVVAILTTHSRSEAADNTFPPDKMAGGGYGTSGPAMCEVNGYDQYRQSPDMGAPGSPAYGFKHFPSPMRAFTTWYRPRAATLTKAQRCAEEPFRPKGFGNSFARPCDPFRMEYTPYVLNDSCSKYGPTYLLRAADPRCDGCGTCDHCAP